MDQSKISEKFGTQRRVHQGCITDIFFSSNFFLLGIGNVLHAVTASGEGRGGVYCTMTSFPKHFVHADDICLLSLGIIKLGQMGLDLERLVDRVGLKTTKPKFPH